MIYLIEAIGSGRYKIGFSDDPEVRKGGLEQGSPFPLKVIRTWPGAVPVEQQMHRLLERYRVHCEWFLLPAYIVTREGFERVARIAWKRHRLQEVSSRLEWSWLRQFRALKQRPRRCGFDSYDATMHELTSKITAPQKSSS